MDQQQKDRFQMFYAQLGFFLLFFAVAIAAYKYGHYVIDCQGGG